MFTKCYPPTFSLLSDSHVPWYMFATSAYMALSYLLRDIDKRKLLPFLILLACFVGYDAEIRDYLYLSRIVVFYPVYILGEITPMDTVLRLSENKRLKWISAGILVVWFAVCLLNVGGIYGVRGFLTGRNPFPTVMLGSVRIEGGIIRLGCYVLSFFVCGALICLTPNRRIPYVTVCGSKTLQVYFWHMPVLYILMFLGLDDIMGTSRLGVLCWLLCGTAVPFLLFCKPFAFPMRQLQEMCAGAERDPSPKR